MALADLKITVLQAINNVQSKLGLNASTAITGDKHATLMLGMINEVLEELDDKGDWPEQYVEVYVTAATAQASYSISVDYPIKRIEEIAVSGVSTPLQVVDGPYLRQLSRSGVTTGLPRHFSILETDANGNPTFRVNPSPDNLNADKRFIVTLYKKTRLLTASDGSYVLPFAGTLMVKGLYYKALLEESSGSPTQRSEAARIEYESAKNEILNRYTADTGTDLQFVPFIRGH